MLITLFFSLCCELLVPRTRRSAPHFAAWCAAEPGPYRAPVFGTVPVLRCTAEEALHRARDTKAALSHLTFASFRSWRPRPPHRPPPRRRPFARRTGAGLAVGFGKPRLADALPCAGAFA